MPRKDFYLPGMETSARLLHRTRYGEIETRERPVVWEPAVITNVTLAIADTNVLSSQQEGQPFFKGIFLLIECTGAGEWSFLHSRCFGGSEAIANYTQYVVGLLGENAIIEGHDLKAALIGKCVEIRNSDEHGIEFRLV